MVSLRPLPGALGVEIRGVDLSAPLDEGTAREILAGFYQGQVAVIPEQSLAPADFARFARIFGRPRAPYPEPPEAAGLPRDPAALQHLRTVAAYNADGESEHSNQLTFTYFDGELTAPTNLQIVDSVPNATQNIFQNDVSSNEQVDAVGNDWELGTVFIASKYGVVNAIRFYKTENDNITHTGKLWNRSTGELLASTDFINESAIGWQNATFPSAIPVTPGEEYITSVNSGRYYSSVPLMHEIEIISGDLMSPIGAGLFNETPGLMPTTSYNNEGYLRDVVFVSE